MTLAHRIVVATLKGLTSLICRIDDAQLAQVPDRGPLIIVTNHVNMLDPPAAAPGHRHGGGRALEQPIVAVAVGRLWNHPGAQGGSRRQRHAQGD